MEIHYTDNSGQVKKGLQQAGIKWLYEACGELEAQVKRNQRVRTGRTKGSWRYVVDDTLLEGYVASDSNNAVWEEFGTGEYALNGDGRKGGWWYKDEKGKWHFTRGKKPHRPLYRAYTALQHKLIERAKSIFRELD